MYRVFQDHENWIDQLPSEVATAVRKEMIPQTLVDGETLFQAWAELKGVYEILQGRIKLVTYSESGKEMITNVITADRTMGESPICAGRTRMLASGVAIGATKVALLPIARFNELRLRIPAINEAVLKRMAQRYLALSSYVVDSSLYPLDFRLAYILYTYSSDMNADSGGNQLIVELTQDDLASMMGVTRQSINRIMKVWEEQGHIELGYGHVVVKNFQDLIANYR